MFFVLAISIATALIFGTAPAFHAGRIDLAGSMRASSRAVTVDRGRRRMRDGLIVVEVALACMLLVGAGLLMRSFMRLQQVEVARIRRRSSRRRSRFLRRGSRTRSRPWRISGCSSSA